MIEEELKLLKFLRQKNEKTFSNLKVETREDDEKIKNFDPHEFDAETNKDNEKNEKNEKSEKYELENEREEENILTNLSETGNKIENCSKEKEFEKDCFVRVPTSQKLFFDLIDSLA